LITLLQRVSEAHVDVEGETIGEIAEGLLILVGVESEDDPATAQRFVDRLLHYRVFADGDGKMNRSLIDVGGGLLLVPQFTLVADTRKGRRPSFTTAAAPAHGQMIFETMVEIATVRYPRVERGRFAADMQVHLVNDGPVTFILD